MTARFAMVGPGQEQGSRGTRRRRGGGKGTRNLRRTGEHPCNRQTALAPRRTWPGRAKVCGEAAIPAGRRRIPAPRARHRRKRSYAGPPPPGSRPAGTARPSTRVDSAGQRSGRGDNSRGVTCCRAAARGRGICRDPRTARAERWSPRQDENRPGPPRRPEDGVRRRWQARQPREECRCGPIWRPAEQNRHRGRRMSKAAGVGPCGRGHARAPAISSRDTEDPRYAVRRARAARRLVARESGEPQNTSMRCRETASVAAGKTGGWDVSASGAQPEPPGRTRGFAAHHDGTPLRHAQDTKNGGRADHLSCRSGPASAGVGWLRRMQDERP